MKARAFGVGVLAAIALACGGARDIAVQTTRTAEAVVESATEPPMPCDKEVGSTPPVGCLSGRIECGQTIEGTTVGGDARWDDVFYASKFCIPALNGHPGPERVYLFDAPAQAGVTIKLTSTCVDLDLVALRFNYDGTCPGPDHAIPQCEGDDHRGGGRVRIDTFDRGERWLVAVDGKGTATGTFRLSVECDMTPR